MREEEEEGKTVLPGRRRRWWYLMDAIFNGDTYRRGDSSLRSANQMLAHSHTGSRDPSVLRAGCESPVAPVEASWDAWVCEGEGEGEGEHQQVPLAG